MRKALTSLGGRLLIPAALFALGLVPLAITGCGRSPGLTVKPPPSAISPMVSLDHVVCGVDDAGLARAEGELTNNAAATTTYELVVEFYDDQGAYYTGAVSISPPLPHGALSTWEATPHVRAKPGGVCEVVEVTPLRSKEDA